MDKNWKTLMDKINKIGQNRQNGQIKKIGQNRQKIGQTGQN